MNQTIILSKKHKSCFEQILTELTFSLKKTYSDEDLLGLTCSILKKSGRQTYCSKKETAVKLFESISKFSRKTLAFRMNLTGMLNLQNLHYIIHLLKLKQWELVLSTKPSIYMRIS